MRLKQSLRLVSRTSDPAWKPSAPNWAPSHPTQPSLLPPPPTPSIETTLANVITKLHTLAKVRPRAIHVIELWIDRLIQISGAWERPKK